MKIAILDDYQNVALEMADWSALSERAEITAFNDCKGAHPLLMPFVLALTVPGLAFLVGSQDFNFPTRAASFTDDTNAKVLTAAETAGTYSIDPWRSRHHISLRSEP